MTTHSAKIIAKTKLSGKGTPFIWFEYFDEEMPTLPGVDFALELRPGVTVEEAAAVEAIFDKYVDRLSVVRRRAG